MTPFIKILSGVAIVIIATFFLHPTISITKDSSSYIDINQVLPHYEFSRSDAPYIEHLNINYKILPPFYSFGFNSYEIINSPKGYNLFQIIPNPQDECVTWAKNVNDELIISTKQNQFESQECSASLTFVKNYTNEELVKIVYNTSWRKDWDGDRFYEEEGIGLINNFDKPVKNYVFIYNHSNTILKRFYECEEINVFVDQVVYPFRTNFLQNSSIIAVKMDLEPYEAKQLIVRCYN